MKLQKNWFTLIEILIWILIFSFVIISWFYTLSDLNIWKIKLVEETDITKEAFYFSQKLFEEIKLWWTIDYEEYFNRKVVWTTTSSWHYNRPTWFGNFWKYWNVWTTTYWESFYFCRSLNWINMWTWWCYQPNWWNDFSATSWWDDFEANLWDPQRYWQYTFQFIDYNSNMNDDSWNPWDENWNGSIRWDDDDEHLWRWPEAFTWWVNIHEIYLISWDKKTRTLFRWNIRQDPYTDIDCDYNITSDMNWCLWTIEFLKLEWRDWWMDHDYNTTWEWTFNWIIDTWIISDSFSGDNNIIAWSDDKSFKSVLDWWYWQPLFPDSISVADFQVLAYPNKDLNYAWKDNLETTNYLRLQMILTPSYKKRWAMRWELPEIKIATTINLVDYLSN